MTTTTIDSALPEVVSRAKWRHARKGRATGLGGPPGSDRIRYPDEYEPAGRT